MDLSSERSQKITQRHLRRQAYLYVRQSTLRQVVENTESTQRQYALRQRAVALGWPIEQVVVIDRDLGQSGASAADREGFQQLVRDVGLGRAGLVMGLEVSRLARNSMDWHRLLEICALTETLILDEDGLYDPAHFNDRLLLGLKRPDSCNTSCSTSRGSVNCLQFSLGRQPHVRRASHHTVASADVPHVLRRKRAPECRSPSLGIELGGDLRVRRRGGKFMDPIDGVGWRLQRIGARTVPFHDQACDDARTPLNLHLDLAGAADAIQLHAVNRAPQQLLAFLIRRGEGGPDRRQVL